MIKKQGYNPHSIRFTKTQVKWLIPLLPMLRIGEYPPNPKETGYVETGGKPIFKPGAKFETPAGIAADLDLRIQRAGVKGDRTHDGMLLELFYTVAPDDELFFLQHIAYALGIEIQEVGKRISNALGYVSGNDNKERSYREYLSHKRAGEYE